VKYDKNSDNGINRSNSVIGIKLLMAQSDPIKRRPLYIEKETKADKWGTPNFFLTFLKTNKSTSQVYLIQAWTLGVRQLQVLLCNPTQTQIEKVDFLNIMLTKLNNWSYLECGWYTNILFSGSKIFRIKSWNHSFVNPPMSRPENIKKNYVVPLCWNLH
jgi:hypothetical protein